MSATIAFTDTVYNELQALGFNILINDTLITNKNFSQANMFLNRDSQNVIKLSISNNDVFTDYGYIYTKDSESIGRLYKSTENSGKTYTFVIPHRADVNENIYPSSFTGTQPHNYKINGVTQTVYCYKKTEHQSFTFTANYSLSHCTSNINDVTLNGEQPYNFTLTADNGYIFESAPTFILSDNTSLQVTKVSDSVYSCIVNVTDSTITSITITGSAIVETISYSFNTVLSHCTITPVITTVQKDSQYTVTVNADNGYIFDIVPSLVYLDENGDFITITGVKNSDYSYSFSFTVGNNLTPNYSYYRLTASASVETETTTKYGAIQIHKITNDNLKAFNNLRYYNGSLSQIDLSNYISSLKLLPFDITTNKSDNIFVSNVDTGISAPIIENDFVSFNLGNVTLTGIYQNELDKKYSKIKLILPYLDCITIDSNLMNETIKVVYKVNVISGDTTAFIFLVKNNTDYLIDSINGNIGVDVPYLVTINNENKIVQNYRNNQSFIDSPKVVIETQLKATNNTVYDCYKKNSISSETGFFKCSYVDIDSNNIPLNEIELIKQKLLTGVYI